MSPSGHCFATVLGYLRTKDRVMNKPTDNPADPFKKALAEATKVMADDPELSVCYSVDPAGQTQWIRLPVSVG